MLLAAFPVVGGDSDTVIRIRAGLLLVDQVADHQGMILIRTEHQHLFSLVDLVHEDIFIHCGLDLLHSKRREESVVDSILQGIDEHRLAEVGVLRDSQRCVKRPVLTVNRILAIAGTARKCTLRAINLTTPAGLSPQRSTLRSVSPKQFDASLYLRRSGGPTQVRTNSFEGPSRVDAPFGSVAKQFLSIGETLRSADCGIAGRADSL